MGPATSTLRACYQASLCSGSASLLTIALVLVVACGNAVAQSQLGSGSLAGVVTDSSAGVVPAAAVTVTNTGTGEVRKTVTGPSGHSWCRSFLSGSTPLAWP